MSSRSSARASALPRGLVPFHLIALTLLLVLASLPTVAQAQLGGLSKRVKDRVTGATARAEEKPAQDEPARAAAPTLNPATVDQFVAGLKVERKTLDDARARVTAGQQQVANAQAARSKAWQDQQQKYSDCQNEKLEQHPKQPQRDSVQQAMAVARLKGQKPQAEALHSRLQKLEQEIQTDAEAACAQYKTDEKDMLAAFTPTESEKNQPSEYETMRAAGDTAIILGARAAGMSPRQYGQVKEAVMAQLKAPGKAGLNPAEAAAVDARRDELADLLKAVGA